MPDTKTRGLGGMVATGPVQPEPVVTDFDANAAPEDGLAATPEPDLAEAITEEAIQEPASTDGRPADQPKESRDAYLRKLAELDKAKREAKEERQAYIKAIEKLTQQPEPEAAAPDHSQMSPEQIVESIAQRVVEQALKERMKDVDTVRQRNDAVVRQIQIIQAQQAYPDIESYQEGLIQLDETLQRELGKDNAMKFSVADMMHILKGREAAARKTQAKPAAATPAPARRPASPVARQGVAPEAVQPVKPVTATRLSDAMKEAWVEAKKKVGPYATNKV